MTDHDIDRLLRHASPWTDADIAALDLGLAEARLLEGVMALADEALLDDETTRDEVVPPRRRLQGTTLLAAAAAVLLVVLVVRSWTTPGRSEDADPDVATDQPTTTPNPTSAPTEDGGFPRMLADDVPAPFELADADTRYGQATVADGSLVVVDEDVVVHEARYAAGGESILVTVAEGEVATNQHEPATIRGRPGWVSSKPASSGRPLPRIVAHWLEAPGVTVTVTANSATLTVDDVLALAEGLRNVGAQEWDAAGHVDVPLAPGEVQALVPDDAPVELTVPADGVVVYFNVSADEVCVVIADEHGRRDECHHGPGPGPDPDYGLVRDRNGWPLVLYGNLPSGATRVVATRDGEDILTLRSGRSVDEGRPPSAEVADPPGGRGPGIYAVAVGVVPDTLTFHDGAGEVVSSIDVDIVPSG